MKNKNILLLSCDEKALNLAEKRFRKKYNFTLIKLPLFDASNLHANDLIDDFIFFSEYYAIICIIDLQKPETDFKLLTYISSVTSKCTIHIESAKLKKNIRRFHRDIIMNVFPNLKSFKSLKMSKINCNFLRIKYPEEIEKLIDKIISSTNNENNIINPRYLAIKLLEKDYVFLDKVKKNHNISTENAEQIIKHFEHKLPIKTIHDKCIELTAEFLLGEYYEKCFEELF